MASSWQRKRGRRCPAKTITDSDYPDDIALLANTPNKAETQLHSLKRAAAGIGLHVNEHKTEYMCYNKIGDISTLDWTSLNLVDKFTSLGSSVSSTEKDIDTRLTKAWTAIDRLSIIWKSDLTDKMKRSFFQAAVVSILLYECTTRTLTKRLEKKLDDNYRRKLRAILNKSWQQHPQGTNYTATCLPSRNAGLWNRSKRVRTLVALLRSLYDKYPGERYEPPYPLGYMVKFYDYCPSRRMDLALNKPRRLICH